MFALVHQPAVGVPTASANRQFKAAYDRTFEITLLAAAALHAAAFLAFPPMTIQPFRMPRAEPMVAVIVPPDIVVPPPPREIVRPVLPDIFTIGDDVSIDATIPRNDLNPFGDSLIPAAPATPGVITVFDRRPTPVVRVKPVYPEIARMAGATGTVDVEVVIDVTGRVVAARVVRSTAIPALERAALTAARQWLFTPARQREHPVRARIVIPFEFGLN
jgi:TonB family protein